MKHVRTTVDFLRLYARGRPLFLAFLRAKEAALYQQFLPFMHPVLDVGCGDGFFARQAFGKRCIDTGLDMPNSRIAEARASDAYRRITVYDGITMPDMDRSYRTVVVNSVLEHVSDVDGVLREIFRVMSPGGVCYATVMAAPWERNLFGAIVFGDLYRRWMRRKQVHINLLTHEQWRTAFMRVGFRIRSVEPYIGPRAARLLDILHYVSFPSLLSYAFLRKWVPVPGIMRMIPMQALARVADSPVDFRDASCLLFVLERPE